MRIEFYPEKKLKKEILKIAGKYLDLNKYKVFFFGSRVKGGGDEHSDIDVGIEGTEEIPFGIMAQIQEDIDNLPILYKIEIVNFKNTSLDFRKVALRHIELITI